MQGDLVNGSILFCLNSTALIRANALMHTEIWQRATSEALERLIHFARFTGMTSSYTKPRSIALMGVRYTECLPHLLDNATKP